MWPGFKSWRRHYMRVEFVVGSLPYSERFSPVIPVFSPLKNQHFQIPIRPGIRQRKNFYVDVLSLNRYLFIYLLIDLFVVFEFVSPKPVSVSRFENGYMFCIWTGIKFFSEIIIMSKPPRFFLMNRPTQ